MSELARRKKTISWGLAAASLAAVLGLFWATPAGIGVSPDTVQYLDCAENLASGNGYATSLHNYYHPILPVEFIRAFKATGAVDLPRRPEIQFPPLYPALIAAAGGLGLGGLEGARWIALFLFGFNIFWTGKLAFRFTGKIGWTALAAIMMAAAEGMLDIHSSGYSEPLFMALILVGLTFLSDFLESGRWRPLLLGAAATGAAYGAKYTAGMFIVACAAGLLLFGPGGPARRVRRAAAYAAAAGVIPALITARNLWAGGDAANRIPGFRRVIGPYLAGVWKTLTSWAAPGASRLPDPVGALSLVAGVLAIVVLAAAAFSAARGLKKDDSAAASESGAPVFFLVSIPFYAVLFFAAATFLDEGLIPDTRLYAPIFPAAVLASVFLLDRAFRRIRAGRLRKILRGLAAAYGALYLLAGWAGLSFVRTHGRGYRGEYWRRPDVQAAVSYVRSCPDALIFSNDDAAIRFFAGRYAYFVSSKAWSGGWSGAGPEFAAELQGAPAVFVYWKRPGSSLSEEKYSLAGQDAIGTEAPRALHLRLVWSGPDVSVYRTL